MKRNEVTVLLSPTIKEDSFKENFYYEIKQIQKTTQNKNMTSLTTARVNRTLRAPQEFQKPRS